MVSDQAMIDSSVRVRLYVQLIFALCVLVVLFVLGLTFLRPAADNMPVIVVVIGIFTPLVVALTAGALKENHDAMNSRLTQLLSLTEKSAKAEGKLEGPTT